LNKKLKKILISILPIALGVFLVWWMFASLSDEGFKTLKNAFKNAHYFWIFASLFLGLLSHISRAYRWSFLLEPLGYKPRFINSVFTIFTAYLVNLLMPRAGEFVRATGISNYEDIPFDKAFGTIVAERIIDVVMLMVIIIIAFFYQFDLLSTLFLSKIPKNPIAVVSILVGVSVVFGLFLYLIKNSKNIFFQKIRTFSLGLFEGVISIFHMKKRVAFIGHTLFIWGMYLLMFYVASFAITETANLSLGAIITGFVVGSLSMAATNGGLGTYPYGVQQVLILYGIAGDPALAFGLLMWGGQTLMIVLLGGLSFLALPFYNK